MPASGFHRSLWTMSVCGSLLAMMSGCGTGIAAPESLSQIVPVTGKVTLDGQPVEGVMVNYVLATRGAATGEVAYGVTDAAGNYQLQTPFAGVPAEKTQGALPGNYRVVLTKLVMPDGSPVSAEMTDAEAESLGARQLLPPKFSSYDASQLSATVKSEPTVNNLELKGGR